VEEAEFIAATDGKTVFAGPAYEAYPPREKLFIVLHELLHVALAHPTRMRELAKRQRDFDPLLYNLAADALINSSLEKAVGLSAPAGAVMLQPLLTSLELWPPYARVEEEIRKWSSEALYLALRQHYQRMNGSGGLRDIHQNNPLGRDLREGLGRSQSNPEAEAEIRSWARRLQLARGVMAGTLEYLAAELPQVKTPWERVLRNYLYRRIATKKFVNYTRPSRRWLGLEYEMHQREGLALPFEPDRSRPGWGGRIAVAVDSSGSIEDQILARFGGEVAQIMAQTGSKVLLIVSDAAVHQSEELEGLAGQERLRKIRYKGRGGTDFRPAFSVAAVWKPDVMVYLTDLEGPAGEAPSFPVLWAIPPGLPKCQAPWGMLVELE
jgi:predicted metal-dependent peptidase